MAKRRIGSFKGRHFTSEVILWALRWYLAFPISYRDLASMLSNRGVEVDHTTLFRWVQVYAPTLERRIRRHLRPCNGSWRVDETYIKVKGVWTYLYRAVDSLGQTIDFLLSARRDASVAQRFLRKALRQPHAVNPRTITADKNPAYPTGDARPEATRTTMALFAAATAQIPQQHRGGKRQLMAACPSLWRSGLFPGYQHRELVGDNGSHSGSFTASDRDS